MVQAIVGDSSTFIMLSKDSIMVTGLPISYRDFLLVRNIKTLYWSFRII